MGVSRVFVPVALCACAWVVWAVAQDAPPPVGKEAVAAFPPRVVKTEPTADRAEDVDPNLAEIKVTFDRPMKAGGHSWIIHRALGAYPGQTDGKPPRWEDDGRTCVLQVTLRPDTLYAVGVNSFRHHGFRDPKDRVAVPHVWVFRTRKADER